MSPLFLAACYAGTASVLTSLVLDWPPSRFIASSHGVASLTLFIASRAFA